jgi:hypothetical protein
MEQRLLVVMEEVEPLLQFQDHLFIILAVVVAVSTMEELREAVVKVAAVQEV